MKENLKEVTSQEVADILRKHKLWLYTDGKQGKKGSFSHMFLNNIDFNHQDLRYIDFDHSYLNNIDFEEADLTNSSFKETECHHSKFDKASCFYIDFTSSLLTDISFKHTNLSWSQFEGSEVYCSDFTAATLFEADFSEAKIDNVNFNHANCACVIFYKILFGKDVSFYNTNLRKAYLDECKPIYQVENIGSRQGTTYYIPNDDRVICGCWNSYQGGTLEAFKKRVEAVYGKKGDEPDEYYYKQYQAVIKYFESLKEID